MSKIIASAAIRGAHKIVERAEKEFKEALEQHERSLVLFREVPAGVPGGWRLLANLVSRSRVSARGTASGP